jgi:hypothetical protein
MKYLLIKVDGNHYISNSLSIEIITMPKVNGNYLLPVNQSNMAYTAFNNIKYIIFYFFNNIKYMFLFFKLRINKKRYNK